MTSFSGNDDEIIPLGMMIISFLKNDN